MSNENSISEGFNISMDILERAIQDAQKSRGALIDQTLNRANGYQFCFYRISLEKIPNFILSLGDEALTKLLQEFSGFEINHNYGPIIGSALNFQYLFQIGIPIIPASKVRVLKRSYSERQQLQLDEKAFELSMARSLKLAGRITQIDDDRRQALAPEHPDYFTFPFQTPHFIMDFTFDPVIKGLSDYKARAEKTFANCVYGRKIIPFRRPASSSG